MKLPLSSPQIQGPPKKKRRRNHSKSEDAIVVFHQPSPDVEVSLDSPTSDSDAEEPRLFVVEKGKWKVPVKG